MMFLEATLFGGPDATEDRREGTEYVFGKETAAVQGMKEVKG